MRRKNFLIVLAVIAFLSTAASAQVPNKDKVIAGAERAFEKVARAYVAPAPGCAAAVSLNGETIFEKAGRGARNVHASALTTVVVPLTTSRR